VWIRELAMYLRVLAFGIVLIAVVPIAIGLHWILVDGKEITAVGFAASLLFGAALFGTLHAIIDRKMPKPRRKRKTDDRE
jgi:NhaP-type Na+/H+ or K+/H+ antiporter